MTTLHLGDACRGAVIPADLPSFLRYCPTLPDLAIWECRVNFESTITAICTELKLLKCLHFNSNVYEGGLPTTLLPAPSKYLHTLQISGPSISDADLDALLHMLASNVCNLIVSIRDLKPIPTGFP